MAVIPTDQMSHSSLYPPFRATAATSGAILGAQTLREPGVTQGGGRETLWCGDCREERHTERGEWGGRKRDEVQREPDEERKMDRKRWE